MGLNQELKGTRQALHVKAQIVEMDSAAQRRFVFTLTVQKHTKLTIQKQGQNESDGDSHGPTMLVLQYCQDFFLAFLWRKVKLFYGFWKYVHILSGKSGVQSDKC